MVVALAAFNDASITEIIVAILCAIIVTAATKRLTKHVITIHLALTPLPHKAIILTLIRPRLHHVILNNNWRHATTAHHLLLLPKQTTLVRRRKSRRTQELAESDVLELVALEATVGVRVGDRLLLLRQLDHVGEGNGDLDVWVHHGTATSAVGVVEVDAAVCLAGGGDGGQDVFVVLVDLVLLFGSDALGGV